MNSSKNILGFSDLLCIIKTMSNLNARDRQTALDLCLHLSSTIILAVIIVRISGNLLYGFVCILGGIFLDLDHLVDYFLSGRKRFILKDFMQHKYLASGKIYLLLHSWEINLIILALALFSGSGLLSALFLAMTMHLLIDNLQRENSLFYFLIYRIHKGFDYGVMLPKGKETLFKSKEVK